MFQKAFYIVITINEKNVADGSSKKKATSTATIIFDRINTLSI